MSGHSKWSQIRHKKGAADKKRSQVFARISSLITIAARKGTDPKSNPPLAQIIARAKSENMPNDSIERAIKRVADKSQTQTEELLIDAIGPGGIALRIRAVTDNRNRTMSEVKLILTKNNSKLVPPGSIDWMFASPAPEISELDTKSLDSLLEALDDHPDIEDVKINTD